MDESKSIPDGAVEPLASGAEERQELLGAAAPSKRPLPPGPSGAEAAASFARYQQDPIAESEHYFERYGDIVAVPRGPFVTVFLFHPDHMRHVLVQRVDNYTRRTTAAAQLRAAIGNGLVTADKPEWARMRRLAASTFTRKMSDAQLPMFNAQARALIETWARAGQSNPVNVHEDCGLALLNVVGLTLLGEAFTEQQAAMIRHAIDVSVAQGGGRPRKHVASRDMAGAPDDVVQKYEAKYGQVLEAQTSLHELMLHHIKRSRSVPTRQGLLASLMDARDEDGTGYSDEEVAEQLKTLVVAGHDTTMGAISYTLYALAHHPEALTKVREEIARVRPAGDITPEDIEQLSYTTAAVSEAMRLYPPVAHLDRRCEEEDEIGGFRIPKGAAIALCPAVTQRRADMFPEPLRFWPERMMEKPSSAYFPFGMGPKICLGRGLALAESTLFVARIVRDLDVKPVEGFVLRLQAAMTTHPRDGYLPLWISARS